MTQVSKQETPFRIGGVYRQQDGDLVKVIAVEEYRGTNPDCYPGLKAVNLEGGGTRNIHGKCCSFVGTPIPYLDLIPGELHEVDGQWVARGVEEEKVTAFIDGVIYQFGADTVEVFTQDYLTDPNAAMIARDGPAKPKTYAPFTPFVTFADEPVSTAKPNPFPSFRNPDSCNGPADHLNAARHQMAGMKG